MKVPGLRSSDQKVGGIVFFGRMLDKIRLHAVGQLPPGYNLGASDWSWFDHRTSSDSRRHRNESCITRI